MTQQPLRALATNDPKIKESKLTNHGEWRIRVGDWRIRFTRDIHTRTIIIQRVLPRGRAYNR
jgi:mRNA-degrading endonuclease RelE of RelBE toxin-antitoxin system